MPDAGSVAVMEVDPAPTAVTSPELLTAETEGVDELHVTDVVKSCVVLSE